MAVTGDVESSRAPSEDIKRPTVRVAEASHDQDVTQGKQERVRGIGGILNFLEKRGDVELRGCTPVPYEERKETNYSKIFTLWFCMSCNPLP
jgi:hypothetical protein